ncbi:MAG: glycosyl hydrolase 115 family protein [Cytophagaceae bacterium]|nr:glycosyl hydrolase 115 family protein [Cytophagaceae bacterium]
MKKLLCVLSVLFSIQVFAVKPDYYVVFQNSGKDFPIVAPGFTSKILVSSVDHKGVIRAAGDLVLDIERVSGQKTELLQKFSKEKRLILAGTLGKNSWINKLIKNKKLDVSAIAGKWETFQTQIIQKPFPGVDEALVIVGSDKRGTIYGIYDLSEQMGVSPWHFWADVPAQKHAEIYVKPEKYSDGEPKVKYRGIFLNDEAPCLSGWTNEKNGGFNQKLYTSIFELILRLKGNYLWPAMWGNAFHVDDPMNPVLADEYGVVIGTSHHEPLMRAHDEWRRYGKDKGKWDYTKNDSTLREFWRESVKERYKYDNIFTVGMRGDGDEPMSRETATGLLEKIVTDQRKIIEELSGKPASDKPQLWALYKEVQDYYDKGMRVPDDITLLLCDDNWGNIRKLPGLNEKPRKGGYGIYYHFDYVGGPRNYKWVNTNPLPKIWEQMHLAYEYNAREIWIVNVGDLKPMEFPISFFLDYAWNPDNWPVEKLPEYSKIWAKQTFGDENHKEIADYLEKYAKYNARVKPELLTAKTYNLESGEWKRVVQEYSNLAEKALRTNEKIPSEYKDAYYQLVLYPVLACSNLYEMYYAHAKNLAASKDSCSEANIWADKVEYFYKKDQELSDYFNQKLAGGKWNHFADQNHIGYTYWQQPRQNTMPKVIRIDGGKTSEEFLPEMLETYTPGPKEFKGFLEEDGFVSIEAVHFSRKINSEKVEWKIIPDIGRTGDGITIFPVNIASISLTENSPRLEYDMFWKTEGEANLTLMVSPTLEFNGNQGLKLAVSIDGEKPEIIDMHADRSLKEWERAVSRNAKYLNAKIKISGKGKHTLKVWAIDPAVVLQKIVISVKDLPSTHLGPVESVFQN